MTLKPLFLSGLVYNSRLKKQSQFAGGQNDAILALTMVYGDLWQFRAAQNKANSKPNKANCRPSAGNPKY